MSSLFSPVTFRSLQLKNRLIVSPMCMYSSKNGFANDFHVMHMGQFAAGGFALAIAEATAVEPEGRISPDDAGLWIDEQIEPLARTTRLVKQMGGVAGVQLGHAGRKAAVTRPWGAVNPGEPLFPHNGGWQVVAPSDIPFSGTHQVPHALTIPEIHRIQKSFETAAKRAIEAGYDVVEVHGAHGYLLHQFLSPLSNRRTDEYGGSFDNRTRMIVETTRRVRKVWPENKPLFVRISATDWAEGGWDLEQSIALAKKLKLEGVDLIDVSTGGLIPDAVIKPAPGFQVPFAEAIRKQAGIATGAVGWISDAKQAEEIIASGKADVVLMARGALRDPHFPYHAARELGVNHSAIMPGQYARA